MSVSPVVGDLALSRQAKSAVDLATRPDDPLRRSLSGCSAGLIRQMAERFLRPRAKLTPDELAERLLTGFANPVLVDRRCKELSPPARGLLALIDMSRQPAWRVRELVELLSGLQPATDLAPLLELCSVGMLLPEAPPPTGNKWSSVDEIVVRSAGLSTRLLAPESVTARAAVTGRPTLDESAWIVADDLTAREADGFEWLIRLGVLWQQISATPVRLTTQGQFFKKDWDRLREGLLADAPSGSAAIPDLGPALVDLGLAVGLLQRDEAEIQAGTWPAWANGGLAASLAELWAGSCRLFSWNAWDGWHGHDTAPTPALSMQVLVLALLLEMPPEAWTTLPELTRWLVDHHAFFRVLDPAPPDAVNDADQGDHDGPDDGAPRRHLALVTPARGQAHSKFELGLAAFLAGWAYELRLTQLATAANGTLHVRLTPLGRAILSRSTPPPEAEHPRTLLVQPNLEVIAYRQGLSPGLVADLSRFATWISLGPACTLRIEPASVYRGMETGCPQDRIETLLERHGTKETPAPVLQALRTWAGKRERLSLYQDAALLEFTSEADLESALARGLPGQRLADRLLLVASEADLDLQHFRILANRDYRQPPGVCVTIGSDGVTLMVDRAKADLLLDAEIERLADSAPEATTASARVFRLTPTSLARAAAQGWPERLLEEWFQRRCGTPMPATVRLLSNGGNHPPLQVGTLVVVQTPSETIADALWQWPPTRQLLLMRLGPTALAVRGEAKAELLRVLEDLGWRVDEPSADS